MPSNRHSVKKRTTDGQRVVKALKQLSADLKADRIPTPKPPRPATARREKVIDVAARLQAFEQKLKSGKPEDVMEFVDGWYRQQLRKELIEVND